MTRLIGVYGAGGCGRGILPLIRSVEQGTDSRLVFIDDGQAGKAINGQQVLAWTDFVTAEAAQKSVCLAVAAPATRARLAQQCDDAGIALHAARAASVVEMDDVVIGEGACLSPFVVLTSNIRIGRAFHANIRSHVEHDCIIGDYVTFAPGVSCNGNIVIEDHAYIGAGAVIRHGIPGQPLVIGRGAVIGMGAIVTKTVPAGTTVVGNPARPMVRQ